MESEADTFEFDETLEDIDSLKNQIKDLENQIEKFKESNKKLETIKSLKERISALNDEVADFKEKAEGKEAIQKELDSIKSAIKQKEYEEFINKQIEKGILVPANKNILMSVLKELDSVQP